MEFLGEYYIVKVKDAAGALSLDLPRKVEHDLSRYYKMPIDLARRSQNNFKLAPTALLKTVDVLRLIHLPCTARLTRIIVNISVENLAPCKKLLRVELDAKSVDETFDAITKDYQKQAALPGFRPGKAPRDMVVKKYEADIKDEAKRKLIGDNLPQGARGEKNLTSSATRTSRKSSLAAGKTCSSPRRSRPRRNFNCRNTRACPPSAKTNP